MKRNTIIQDWLDQHGDPEVDKLVTRNLAIANKVQSVLEEKELSNKDFAEILGKSPSEISKWLSGTHNLTMKSIIKMELALGVDLIHVEKEYQYVYLGKIEGNFDEAKNSYLKGNYKKSMPAYAS